MLILFSSGRNVKLVSEYNILVQNQNLPSVRNYCSNMWYLVRKVVTNNIPWEYNALWTLVGLYTVALAANPGGRRTCSKVSCEGRWLSPPFSDVVV